MVCMTRFNNIFCFWELKCALRVCLLSAKNGKKLCFFRNNIFIPKCICSFNELYFLIFTLPLSGLSIVFDS